ncbi:MAG: hypothetical protein ACD_79C01010G0001 [uncultured bacterium]|nr:MAG: hypothetical protein ACD_79C01010G0001 [uncultured bacterium]
MSSEVVFIKYLSSMILLSPFILSSLYSPLILLSSILVDISVARILRSIEGWNLDASKSVIAIVYGSSPLEQAADQNLKRFCPSLIHLSNSCCRKAKCCSSRKKLVTFVDIASII